MCVPTDFWVNVLVHLCVYGICGSVCVCLLLELAYKMTVKYFLCQLQCYRSFSHPSSFFLSLLLTLHAPLATGHMLSLKARPSARLEYVSVTMQLCKRESRWHREQEKRVVAGYDKLGGDFFDCGSNPDVIFICLNNSVLSLVLSLTSNSWKINGVIHSFFFSLVKSLKSFVLHDMTSFATLLQTSAETVKPSFKSIMWRQHGNMTLQEPQPRSPKNVALSCLCRWASRLSFYFLLKHQKMLLHSILCYRACTYNMSNKDL